MFEDINDGITHYDINDLRKQYDLDILKKDIKVSSSKENIYNDKCILSNKDMVYLRLESLKISKDISIFINDKYSLNKLKDIDLFGWLDAIHEMAEYNLKYILGEK